MGLIQTLPDNPGVVACPRAWACYAKCLKGHKALIKVDTHGLTPVALVAEKYYVLSEGFRTLRLPRKERFHLRAYTRSPQRIFDR